MRASTPYDVFDILQEIGEPLPLRTVAKRIAESGDDLDRVLVHLEETLLAYASSSRAIGEEPVVTLNELTDEVESPCLRDLADSLISLQNEALVQNRAWISYYLRRMPWENFERLCQELLERMDVSDAELTNRGPDGGIDFTGTYFNPMLREMVVPIIGQAKRWGANTPVGVDEVRSLTAKLAMHRSHAAQGFLITTSYFTGPAIAEAKESPKKIYLWDMQELLSRLVELKVGVSIYGPPTEIVERPHWERFLEKP